jgi:hypothetical protein
MPIHAVLLLKSFLEEIVYHVLHPVHRVQGILTAVPLASGLTS